MKKILLVAAIAIVVTLGSETREIVRAHEIPVTCEARESDASECLSFGPLGAVSLPGVRFWVRSFTHHALERTRGLMHALVWTHFRP